MRALPAPGRARAGSRTATRTAEGAVTAETALALPLLLGVTVAMVWLVALAATQVRVVDAARETARAVARDEPVASAVALGRRVAPTGSRFDVAADGEVVRVRVAAEVAGPGGLLEFLPPVTLDAQAVAAAEPS